jgi:nucleotide-binding universal stress UspA family protein
MKFEPFVPTSFLVAVDDALAAVPSLRLVERLAAAARARVVLLHVVPYTNPAASHNTVSMSLGVLQARGSNHEARFSLWALADQLRGHGLDTSCLIEMGDPGDVIVDQAQTLGADLLVLGTRFPPAVERILLGSVADRVVQRAQAPVLVVPAGARAWRPGQRVDALITLDGSPPAERALPIGAGLARVLEGNLQLLRVAKRADLATARAYLEDVSAALESEGMHTIREAVLPRASVGATIGRFAKQHGVGLIAMASHGRGGLSRAVLGSVAADVVTSAGTPVVVIPPRTVIAVRRKASSKGATYGS